MSLTKKQKYFLNQTPIGVWLSPSPEKYIKKLGKYWDRTVMSLKRRGYIMTAREIGGQDNEWAFRVKRLK